MAGFFVNAGAFNTPGLVVGMLWAVRADTEAQALAAMRTCGAFPPSGEDFSIAGALTADRAQSLGLHQLGQAKPL